MYEFILLWVFTNNMVAIRDEVMADQLGFTPMFFWNKKSKIELIAIIMFIISLLVSFFLVKWYIVIIAAIFTRFIGRFIFKNTGFLNLVIYFFFSLIGFIGTLAFTLFSLLKN